MGLDQRITMITYFEDYTNYDNFLSELEIDNTKIEVKHTFLLGTFRKNYLLVEMCDLCMKEREEHYDILFDDFKNFVDDFEFEDYCHNEEDREEKEEEIEELRELLLKMEKAEQLVKNNNKIDRYEFIYESW